MNKVFNAHKELILQKQNYETIKHNYYKQLFYSSYYFFRLLGIFCSKLEQIIIRHCQSLAKSMSKKQSLIIKSE